MKTKYYALFDLQTGDYMATGLNCTNLKEVKRQLISYLDGEGDNENWNNHSLLSLCDIFEFVLDYSDTKFPDKY